MFFKSKEKEKISIDEIRNINNSVISSLMENNIVVDHDTINNVINKYFEIYDPLIDKCKQLQQDRYNENFQRAILEIESKLEDCFKRQDSYSYEIDASTFGDKRFEKVRDYFIKRGFDCFIHHRCGNWRRLSIRLK